MAKNPKNTGTLLDSLDALIAQHHLMKHPFHRAWVEGRLSKESLQLYAEQCYLHIRAYPENLRAFADRAPGPLAKLAEENLADELDPAAPHPQLWRQFALAVGVSEAEIEGARPLPGIAALLDTFDEIVSEGTLPEAVASLYAFEAQAPELCTQQIAGLRRFYGITDPQALAYFSVHEEADMRHRAAWSGWLAQQNEADSFTVLFAAERSLKAQWGALDAVYPLAFAAKN